MKRLPGGREVERSLKGTLNDVRSAIKQIKEYAGKMLDRGDYSGAEELISKARQVEAFEAEVEAFYKRWRVIQGGSEEGGEKAKPIPVWKYYGPALRAIIELGGAARMEAIESQMEPLARELSVVHESNSAGTPSEWKSKVKPALHAMAKEGFVQRDKKEWRITPLGRKAAEAKWKDGHVE